MRRLSESGLSAFKASFVCTYREWRQWLGTVNKCDVSLQGFFK